MSSTPVGLTPQGAVGRSSLLLLLLLAILTSACASQPATRPSGQSYKSGGNGKGLNINDACSIFAERPEWLYASLEASQRWQVPIFVFLAFIHQESKFNANARPRDANGKPLSSAYGYAQALDGTWKEYQGNTGNNSGRRDRFNDAVDFIGWYVLRVHTVNSISKWNAKLVYLNYHEGIGGYRRGLHKQKPWLLKVAIKVDSRASLYHRQLRKCGIPIYLEKNGSVPEQYRQDNLPDKPLQHKVRWF